MADLGGPVQLSTRTRIGRYQIQKLLGRGGMGEVYKAFDPGLDRVVALKTIVAGGNDAALKERLLREARACGRLQHPGIVMVHDIGEADGVVFIAMEFLEGKTLADAASAGVLSAEDTFETLIQMLDALDYAHGEGVVHRDIKPSNVLLLPNGRIKILDFGIARIAQADPLTMTGEVIGTPNYMSPEQMKAHALDGRTDIYSTGIVGYELLTGRRAFDGETVTAVMLKVLGEPAPPMQTAVSLACPEVEAVIQRAIAKAPTDRYQHAREFADALRSVIAMHRELIVRASRDGEATLLSAGTSGRTAPQTPDNETVRVGATAAAPPRISAESTLRVPPAPPAAPPPPAALPRTIRQSDPDQAPAPVAKVRSGSTLAKRWPLIAAAVVLVGAIVYVAPHLQPANEVEAGRAPAPAPTVSGAPTPAPAPPTATTAPLPAPPPASTQVAQPPAALSTGAPAAAQTGANSSTVSNRAPGALDSRAVSFAAGSDPAVTSALVDALKESGITRQASGARWVLTAKSQVAVRANGLGSTSALTADYTGDLVIQDRQAGTTDERHFDGHAMEFGEPVVKAAAARALAKQMADALVTIIK